MQHLRKQNVAKDRSLPIKYTSLCINNIFPGFSRGLSHHCGWMWTGDKALMNDIMGFPKDFIKGIDLSGRGSFTPPDI